MKFHTLPIGKSEAAMLATSTDQLDLVLAAAYSIHGNLWYIEDVTTGGDIGPPVGRVLGPHTLYVVLARDWAVALNATDTLIPDARWQYIAPWVMDDVSGELVPIAIDEGNVLTSNYDGRRFVVESVYQDVHNTVGTCELL